MHRYLPLFLILTFLTGCNQEPQTLDKTQSNNKLLTAFPSTENKPSKLLEEPMDAALLETISEALPIWRKYAAAKPTLVLLSQNPFLALIPEQLKDKAQRLVSTGTPAEFRIKAVTNASDPVILPHMAVRAALEGGYFSKIIWVLPFAEEAPNLSLSAFRQQLIDTGSATETEAHSFKTNEDGFSGRLGSLPIDVIPYQSLDRIKGSAIVHLDLSFLKALYTSEIKTPIHPLTYEVLAKLRTAGISAFATTISHSHRSEKISPEVRFLGALVRGFIKSPERLDQPAEKNNLRHQQALYLNNFFQKEKVLELYLKMEEAAPRDASIKFALYGISRQFKRGDRALDYLAQAVELDSGYALEYLDLAPMAFDMGERSEALRMLSLAEKAFPDDPFIIIRQAELALMSQNPEIATQKIKELEGLTWSKLFYPQIPEMIATMKAGATTDNLGGSKKGHD